MVAAVSIKNNFEEDKQERPKSLNLFRIIKMNPASMSVENEKFWSGQSERKARRID